MSIAAVTSPQTLADRVVPRTLATNIALILGGVVLMAVLAHVSVPMWPVPVTGQTLGVLLVGASLGAWRGAASMVAYLVAGIAGLPVFAGATAGPASVLAPSFGFIIGFIFAAFAIGWLAEHEWDRSIWRSMLGFGLASLIPFAFGMPYLAFILSTLQAPHDAATVLSLGFTPFIVGGIIKWAIAAAVLPLAWKAVRSLDARK